jgi:serine/threonine protein kinase
MAMQGLQAEPGILSGHPGSQQERKMDFQYRSGDQPLDGYTIKRGLGWGGFGEVYFAVSNSGKEVALKLVRRHLDVELRGVSQCINLKSPNLITIYDVKENDRGESWIVMEYVSGASLQQRLGKTNGPLPYPEIQFWLSGIANGVDYLHRNGIVHRDLKPGNIFSDDDIVKIGDYGLSKFISVSRRSGQTQSVGTVHYMAPEISTGNYGRSVDIYSTAIIAFEMLSGDIPFDGETPGEVLMKHLTAAPNLSKVDAKYRPIFERALAKAPEERYGSAKDLLDAIEAVTAGRPLPIIGQASTSSPAVTPVTPERPAPEPVVNGPANHLQETIALGRRGAMELSIPPLPGTFAAKRRFVGQVFWQVFLAGLLSAIIPTVALRAWESIDRSYRPGMVDFVSALVMTGLTSAGLIVLGHYWQRARSEPAARHLHALIFGLGIGLLWFGLNTWLLQIEPGLSPELSWESLFSERVVEALGPHLLGYLTLCGLTFATPDWFSSVDPQRKSRVTMGWIIWPAVIAYAVGSVIHEVDAGDFALVLGISGLIVQWVSPHESFLARRRRTRRQFAGR